MIIGFDAFNSFTKIIKNFFKAVMMFESLKKN